MWVKGFHLTYLNTLLNISMPDYGMEIQYHATLKFKLGGEAIGKVIFHSEVSDNPCGGYGWKCSSGNPYHISGRWQDMDVWDDWNCFYRHFYPGNHWQTGHRQSTDLFYRQHYRLRSRNLCRIFHWNSSDRRILVIF